MRKSSSHAPRGNKQDGKNDFKGNDGRKPFNKDKPYRKSYDGRPQAPGDKPYRSSKPYSGRVADSDRGASAGDGERRPYGKPGFKGEDNRRPQRGFDGRKPGNERGGKRNFDKPFRAKDGDHGKPGGFEKRGGKHNAERRIDERRKREADGERKPFERRERDSTDKPRKKFDRPDKKKEDTRPFRERTPKVPDEVSFSKDIDDLKPKEEKPFKLKKLHIPSRDAEQKPAPPAGRKRRYHEKEEDQDEEDRDIEQTNGPRLEMPLNKYIAHSGECSRRDAAEMVKQGKVKVNGELVLEPGYRVKHDDKVTLSGKKLTPQKGFSYVLLNKPKGFITTNDDPQGRKTVMDLVNNSGVDRLFSVGRLDRETSGLLLMTNDGDLAQKLSHPSYHIKKVYHVTLDKPITKADFERVLEGVELEDGKAIVDALAHLENKNEVGLEIHSGRNRIVRRIFESLGYVVEKLDRVMYAGLTKKNLPRSKWRFLTEHEVVLLKHFKG